MQDFIPKGNGNSRSLKSSIPDGTTWEQAIEMLRNGTFPIDIGAANEVGVLQKGNPLNKSTLLKDETATLFKDLPENPVPDEVFKILSKAALVGEDGSIKLPDSSAVNVSKIEAGFYVGTGKYGSSDPNTIECSFPAKYAMCVMEGNTAPHISNTNIYEMLVDMIPTTYTAGYGFGYRNDSGSSIYVIYGKRSEDKKSISWYSDGAFRQNNDLGRKYYYLFLG